MAGPSRSLASSRNTSSSRWLNGSMSPWPAAGTCRAGAAPGPGDRSSRRRAYGQSGSVLGDTEQAALAWPAPRRGTPARNAPAPPGAAPAPGRLALRQALPWPDGRARGASGPRSLFRSGRPPLPPRAGGPEAPRAVFKAVGQQPPRQRHVLVLAQVGHVVGADTPRVTLPLAGSGQVAEGMRTRAAARTPAGRWGEVADVHALRLVESSTAASRSPSASRSRPWRRSSGRRSAAARPPPRARRLRRRCAAAASRSSRSRPVTSPSCMSAVPRRSGARSSRCASAPSKIPRPRAAGLVPS